jgi:hypothetical protein
MSVVFDPPLLPEEDAMNVMTSGPLSVSTDSAVSTDDIAGTDGADVLVRFAMRVDATMCAGIGLLIAMTADPLSRLSGLSASAEWFAGAALVAYSAALYALAAAPSIRRIGIGIVVANVVFSIVAVAVLAARLLPLTGAGVVMMLAAVAATLGLASLQYLGVRRLA